MSVRIGHLLGAGHPAAAKKASRVAAMFSLVIGIVNSLWIFFAKEKWAGLFNNDAEVVALAARIVDPSSSS